MTKLINCFKHPHTFIGLSLGVFLSLPVIPAWATETQLKSTEISEVSLKTPKTSVTFEPPNENEPDNTVGGASRDRGGVCSPENIRPQSQQTSLELLPLMPQNNHGLTVSEYPTFYAYIPESDRAEQVFFSIQNQNDRTIYQTEFSLNNPGGGIISFSLPEDAPPLEVGQSYQWSMVLMCHQKMRPDSPRISAWIERVEPFGIVPNTAEDRFSVQLAALYAQHGIWYDSLNILANLWHGSVQTSTDYAHQWVEFLSQDSVGLEEIASQPLLEQPRLADNE